MTESPKGHIESVLFIPGTLRDHGSICSKDCPHGPGEDGLEKGRPIGSSLKWSRAEKTKLEVAQFTSAACQRRHTAGTGISVKAKPKAVRREGAFLVPLEVTDLHSMLTIRLVPGYTRCKSVPEAR